jgi:hypothetical protein
MFLSEEYKNRIAKLSGLIVCDNCYHSWQKEKGDADPHLCHVCGYDSEKEKFRIEDLKNWMIKKYGKLVNENIGPGPSDVVPMSNVYIDMFNQKFNSKDFSYEYDPENGKFYGEEEYDLKNPVSYSDNNDEMSDENDLNKEEIKDIDKKYKKIKKSMNWKGFLR